MIDLSVIIVSFNNLEIILECLDSLERFNDIGDKLQIIVVDNSTTKDIYEYIIQHYPNVCCIKNENNGFGQGNNVGAKVAQGDKLLFLNPDTILFEPIFEFALDKFRKYEDLALFGMKLVNRNLSSNLSFFYIDRKSILANMMIKVRNHYNIFNRKKMFISGANIFIRKSVFYEIGMFDENYFMYCEDKDLSKSVILAGYKTGFFKEKKIIHLEGGSTNDSLKSFERRLVSEKYYHRKYNLDFDSFIKKERRLLKLKNFILNFICPQESKKIEDKINKLSEITVSGPDRS